MNNYKVIDEGQVMDMEPAHSYEFYEECELSMPIHVAISHSGFPPEDWNRVVPFTESTEIWLSDAVKSDVTITHAEAELAVQKIIARRVANAYRYD
jgi:hypothetical protein